MKNLPEKIYAYIPEDDIVGTASIKKGIPHQFVTTEYTRTDAFIEKAKKWMLTHTYMFQSMEEVDLYIEMFIKEMKGE